MSDTYEQEFLLNETSNLTARAAKIAAENQRLRDANQVLSDRVHGLQQELDKLHEPVDRGMAVMADPNPKQEWPPEDLEEKAAVSGI
jgi:uncharacterized protein YlxW (UPF0749 family)